MESEQTEMIDVLLRNRAETSPETFHLKAKKTMMFNVNQTRIDAVFTRDVISLKTGGFLKGSARWNIPLSHANNFFLFCVCSSDTRCSAPVFPLLLSIFHVSESASILGVPAFPPPTGCQNIISQHSAPHQHRPFPP